MRAGRDEGAGTSAGVRLQGEEEQRQNRALLSYG
jgi:hypothetical protein